MLLELGIPEMWIVETASHGIELDTTRNAEMVQMELWNISV